MAHIDWYSFGHATATLAGDSAQPSTGTRTVTVAVTFRGMPARRFWEMEDAAVNIGAPSAAAEDLGRLLLRQFALIYCDRMKREPPAAIATYGRDLAV